MLERFHVPHDIAVKVNHKEIFDVVKNNPYSPLPSLATSLETCSGPMPPLCLLTSPLKKIS